MPDDNIIQFPDSAQSDDAPLQPTKAAVIEDAHEMWARVRKLMTALARGQQTVMTIDALAFTVSLVEDYADVGELANHAFKSVSAALHATDALSKRLAEILLKIADDNDDDDNGPEVA